MVAVVVVAVGRLHEISLAGEDSRSVATSVCWKKHSSGEEGMWEDQLSEPQSGAGEQYLLPDCRAKACEKGMCVFHRYRFRYRSQFVSAILELQPCVKRAALEFHCRLQDRMLLRATLGLRPISLLRLSLLRLLDSNFPVNSLWPWEFHPWVKPSNIHNVSTEIGRTFHALVVFSRRSIPRLRFYVPRCNPLYINKYIYIYIYIHTYDDSNNNNDNNDHNNNNMTKGATRLQRRIDTHADFRVVLGRRRVVNWSASRHRQRFIGATQRDPTPRSQI